ncbi:MAG: transposase [Bryobacterales bacterium]|nr:transposase [Bryobacterales bacterium]
MHQIKDAQARLTVIRARWPEGPSCPHCEAGVRVYGLRSMGSPADSGSSDSENPMPVPEKFKCAVCRRVFSVTRGTALNGTKLSLADWLQAIDGLCAAPRGLSAAELSHILGITRKSALLVLRRIHRARSMPALRSPWSKALRIVVRSPASTLNSDLRRQAQALLEDLRFAERLPQERLLDHRIPASASAFRVTLWPLSPEMALHGLLNARET